MCCAVHVAAGARERNYFLLFVSAPCSCSLPLHYPRRFARRLGRSRTIRVASIAHHQGSADGPAKPSQQRKGARCVLCCTSRCRSARAELIFVCWPAPCRGSISLHHSRRWARQVRRSSTPARPRQQRKGARCVLCCTSRCRSARAELLLLVL